MAWKKLSVSGLTLLLALEGAQAQQTKSALRLYNDQHVNTNGVGGITGRVLNESFANIISTMCGLAQAADCPISLGFISPLGAGVLSGLQSNVNGTGGFPVYDSTGLVVYSATYPSVSLNYDLGTATNFWRTAFLQGIRSPTGQITLSDTSTPAKQLILGYDPSGNFGTIQAVWQGISNQLLKLNPGGGAVQLPVGSAAGTAITASGVPGVGFYGEHSGTGTTALANNFGLMGLENFQPTGNTDTNPNGVYGTLWVNAPRTYNAGGGSISGVKGNVYTMPQLTYTPVANGSGYTVGDVVTGSGGTCSVQPQATITAINAGVPTLVQVTDSGQCPVFPANPVNFTGGTGSGLTANITQGSMTVNLTQGVYGRFRHEAAGTVALAAGLAADACQKSGPGTITKCAGIYVAPTLSGVSTDFYALYTAAFSQSNSYGVFYGSAVSPFHYLTGSVTNANWPLDIVGVGDGTAIDHYMLLNAIWNTAGTRSAPRYDNSSSTFAAYIRGSEVTTGGVPTIDFGRIPVGTNQAGTTIVSVDLANSKLIVNGNINATLPTSAGAGGLFICVDTSGVFYKKATCP